VLDTADRVLLFRFEHKKGALAGQAFWATPGGGLERGETFEQAAIRELLEETGIVVATIGRQVARRLTSFAMPTGEPVEADERYFMVHAGQQLVCNDNWSELERGVISTHRWWSCAELATAPDQIWPDNLSDMLIDAGVWAATT
jgi:8-oxo-dGTP pyrophosphatase MutT (NUDIX family)